MKEEESTKRVFEARKMERRKMRRPGRTRKEEIRRAVEIRVVQWRRYQEGWKIGKYSRIYGKTYHKLNTI